MDDTKADRLPRARPGQIPARPDRVHQQRRRSPERDYSRRSNLLGTPETASSDRDPCPRQSASFDPPQQCKNHRCETHTKQSVFTQPGSNSTELAKGTRPLMSAVPPIATDSVSRDELTRCARRGHDPYAA